jgi:hypothetical protein
MKMIDPPKTKKQAEKQTYGSLYKREYDSDYCAYSVWGKGRGVHNYQCQRSNGHGPAKLYCKQHANIVEGKEVKTKKKESFKLTQFNKLQREIKRLKRLVKRAFDEGWELGGHMSKKKAWVYSDARKLKEKK